MNWFWFLIAIYSLLFCMVYCAYRMFCIMKELEKMFYKEHQLRKTLEMELNVLKQQLNQQTDNSGCLKKDCEDD